MNSTTKISILWKFRLLALATLWVFAQTPETLLGCPGQLLWTNGQVYVYTKLDCQMDGSSCISSPTNELLYFSQIVPTGCGASCACNTTIPNIITSSTGVYPIDPNFKMNFNEELTGTPRVFVVKHGSGATEKMVSHH